MTPDKINVLIACEESQRACIAFRELGFNAFSCDIMEPSGNHPEWHIKNDVLKIINTPCDIITQDHKRHTIYRWDLIIAHPPCTFLTNAATRAFSLNHALAERIMERWENRAKAAVFFLQLYYAPCRHIAVENPVGWMNNNFRKPDQIIHPWQFAESENDEENYKTKRTCLWLKGLPKLRVNKDITPFSNAKKYGRREGSGKVRNWTEDLIGKNRSIERSKTFPGIAKAFALQWGAYILRECNYPNMVYGGFVYGNNEGGD